VFPAVLYNLGYAMVRKTHHEDYGMIGTSKNSLSLGERVRVRGLSNLF
jgi:hypothetical protein